MSQKSDLPFGSEFSPSNLDLQHALELADEHAGNAKEFQDALLQEYFLSNKTTDSNKKTLAYNAKLAMVSYGIIDNQANLTEFGRELFNIREKENELYASLAKHILLNLNGMALVQCIQDMSVSGTEVNLTSLREGLADRGIHYPSGGKHPSMIRLWLEKAGVIVGSRWQVDEARLKQVLGINSDEFGELADLTIEQRAFLRALVNTGVTTSQPANEITRLATATYGVKFPEKSLPRVVLNVLIQAGFITSEKGTEGRGAKPFLVTPTEKLITTIIDPLLDQLAKQTDPKLRVLLRKPLGEILDELKSQDKHVAGLALEAFGFKLMRLVDMDYVATRFRNSWTGGAEVDLIFESVRLIYSRWQVQCKNTDRVSLDDVAKEVGLTHLLKSGAIIMVSTGVIGGEARRYANKIMADSNLAIVMMDGADLERITQRPAAIVDVFEREARHAMKLKSLDLEK